ncbi:NAD(P)-dependent dehydrogenase (short-subunit alcohol dehydrogenase family) [Rhodococcus sp. 27YEA15]|uniref:SDR family NAD(P)-dependent oxidoreductase n=1 Tax=Rhodococcus sp. 27YEA15 TaxID=3156259 RepID=UPI003C7D51E8
MSTDFSTRFTGKTIIVTGAGSGIGRAATLRLLAEGARVVGADVSAPRLEELAVETGTDNLVTVAGDLTDQATVDAIVSAAGTVDGVASVAGITDNWLPAAEMDDDTWQRVFDVNLTAPMRLTRAVLPQMIERGAGALVYVSSEAGFRSSISGAGYTSSKHALNGFVKSVAFYYGPKGVRANAVAPGGVNTNIDIAFNSSYAVERTGKLLETMPTPSVEPEVVAKSILWMLSDDAENINGAILPSDGGWTTI